MLDYFASLKISNLLAALPGGIAQGLIWGIMALGVFITYKLLKFSDLTVDGTLATGGCVTVMLILSGCPVWLALILAVICGMLCGLVTGFLHTVFGIPDILAGILTQISLYSVNLRIMGGRANQAISIDKYDLLVSLRYVSGDIETKVLFFAGLTIFCLLVMAMFYWYFGTEHGSALRATGCNESMAKAQGINTSVIKVAALMLSNGLVALSGGLLAQYQGYSDVKMGSGAIVIGLAAVIIGQVIGNAFFRKGMNFYFTMLFVVLGSVIYYLVYSIVLWLRMPANDMKLFTAVIVALFLAAPHLKETYFRGKKKAGAKL